MTPIKCEIGVISRGSLFIERDGVEPRPRFHLGNNSTYRLPLQTTVKPHYQISQYRLDEQSGAPKIICKQAMWKRVHPKGNENASKQ